MENDKLIFVHATDQEYAAINQFNDQLDQYQLNERQLNNICEFKLPCLLCKDRDSGAILGICIYAFFFDEIKILYIAVCSAMQSKGIASLLLESMQEITLDNNARFIMLEVNPKNDKALNFYLKNNFSVIAMRKKYYENGDHALLVQKDLYGQQKNLYEKMD